MASLWIEVTEGADREWRKDSPRPVAAVAYVKARGLADAERIASAHGLTLYPVNVKAAQ